MKRVGMRLVQAVVVLFLVMMIGNAVYASIDASSLSTGADVPRVRSGEEVGFETTYKGKLTFNRDETKSFRDYYTFTNDTEGYVQLSFGRVPGIDVKYGFSDTYNIAVEDADGNVVLSELYKGAAFYQDNDWETIHTPYALLGTGTYTLKVDAIGKNKEGIEYSGNEEEMYAFALHRVEYAGAESNELQSGVPVAGAILDRTQNSKYTIEVPGDGYLKISLDHEDAVERAVSGNQKYGLYFVGVSGDPGPFGNDDSVNTYGSYSPIESVPIEGWVEKGTYRISVGSYKTTAPYYLTAEYTPDDGQEKESNDSTKSANLLRPGESRQGRLTYWSGAQRDDVDYYKIEAKENGRLELQFSYDLGERDPKLWEAVLLDANENELLKLTDTLPVYEGDTGSISCDSIGVKAGMYYVRISGGPLGTAPDLYEILADFTPCEDWEREYDNSRDASSIFAFGTPVYGRLMSSSDVDVYCFATKNEDGLAISLDVPAETEEGEWTVYVYQNSQRVWTEKFSLNASSEKHAYREITVKPAFYYVSVEHSESGTYSDVPYRLTVEDISETSEGLEPEGNWTQVFAVDAETGAVLDSGLYEVINERGTSIASWSGGETRYINKLRPGKSYTVKMNAAPDGHLFSGDVVFHLDENANLVMDNETAYIEDGKVYIPVRREEVLEMLIGDRLDLNVDTPDVGRVKDAYETVSDPDVAGVGWMDIYYLDGLYTEDGYPCIGREYVIAARSEGDCILSVRNTNSGAEYRRIRIIVKKPEIKKTACMGQQVQLEFGSLWGQVVRPARAPEIMGGNPIR